MPLSNSARMFLGVVFIPVWLTVSTCAAAGTEKRLEDMTLEELTNVIVTSVSGREERLSDAAASIYVISSEDIRRSGARSLPEALRLAPNVQVARTSASTYAISSRGFNNALGNKLLVLIDGRTVYTPLFSGVFWDQQDVMLEDVARIEVISGPGATLWGANAVNGVINIITRGARDTQGLLASAGVGNLDRTGAIRYGGKIGDAGHYRVYAKDIELQNTRRENGASVPDGWRRQQVGFRTDWGPAARNFTVQGDAYTGHTETRPVGGATEISGVNLLARWTQQFASGSDIRVQSYYDRNERVDRIGFQGDVSTFDIEFQHGIPLGSHRILWGAGYRRAHDEIEATLPPLQIFFVPPSRTLTWQNIFVQDSWHLHKDVELTLGVKAESNDYTGWEYLPSARFAWKPLEGQLIWGAVSRAVRAPARLDRDFNLAFVFGGLNLPLIMGGPNFRSEVAKVYEIGYRAQPSSVLSYSISAFRHEYDRLRSGMPPPAFIENQIEGFSNGVEGWGSFQATPAWRLMAGFSTLRQHLGVKAGSTDPTGPIALGNDPDHQWFLRSSLNLRGGHEVDVFVRRVGSLPLQPPGVRVPAYTAVDARWGWQINRTVELSLTVQNLLDPAHPEFDQPGTRSEYRRSAFFNVTLRN
ncbi:MAG TPA: TonB-dependent receptor [Burkholderiales bacterium]|nr:TonB-dependent receptor [Burkholderiales bacterium]